MSTLKRQNKDGTWEYIQLTGQDVSELVNSVDSVTSRLADIAQSETSVISHGFDLTGIEDNTARWGEMIAGLTEGTRIIFPKGTYKGNFISKKSFEIDFNGSTVVPVRDNIASVKFEGSVDVERSVTGNPEYGNASFVIDDSTGLHVGDIGYLVDDSIRPSDSTPNVNTELIKIKGIDKTSNTITVYDMIRSNQNTGSVKFFKVNPIKNPIVNNLIAMVSDSNTFPALWFFGCENPQTQNVEVYNSVGVAVRFEYCYNWITHNVKIVNPRLVGSGQGYGIASNQSRNGYAFNSYGNGTRHLVDFKSSYNCHAERVIEEDGKSAVVVLAHNGYGGNNSVNDVICTADSYAVSWSSQGVANRDLQCMRDVNITKIRHTIPNRLSNETLYTVFIRADFANLAINDVSAIYLNETADPSSASNIIRLNGNMLGATSVKNIVANSAGSVLYVDSRSTKGLTRHTLLVDNISVNKTDIAIRLRGIYFSNVDNVVVHDSGNTAILLEAHSGVTPYRSSIGDNIHISGGAKIIDFEGMLAVGLRGKYPRLTNGSSASKTVANGDTIEFDKIISSGGYLVLTVPVGVDITLNSITPLDAPMWIGQELTIVVNGMGYVGDRGNVIIPVGSSTYADGGVAKTLLTGNIYKLVGYSGKWKVVAQ